MKSIQDMPTTHVKIQLNRMFDSTAEMEAYVTNMAGDTRISKSWKNELDLWECEVLTPAPKGKQK